MSAIPLTPGAAPSPAAAPGTRAERGEARRVRRWYTQPALMIGIGIMAVILAMVIAAPLITPYNPNAQNLNAALLGPSARHLLGTDQLGRDTWTRLLYGTRLDLRIAFIAVLFPFTIGIFLGSVAGYFGGWVDSVIMRVVDV
ncbi:MAG TPA: ABC transporter, partial [Streptosporangiaceae bacterium]|nr:ABC transporter [Streptosporangiaceae bacterium]